MGRRRPSTEAPFCGAAIPSWRFWGKKPLLLLLRFLLRVSAAAGRNDRQFLLSRQALWSLPVSRGRQPISPSRISRGSTTLGIGGPRPSSPPVLSAFRGCPPAQPQARFLRALNVSLPGRVSDSSTQLSVESSPVPRVLFRGAPAVASHHHPAAAPNPPSPEGCSVKADLRAGNLLGGERGVCREEGKSRTLESVGQAVAPPSPPRHSTEVGPGAAQETRGGISDSAQGLVSPR